MTNHNRHVDLSEVSTNVAYALEEDVGASDLTAELIPADLEVAATIPAVLYGRPWVDEILQQVAPAATASWFTDDGSRTASGAKVVEILGQRETCGPMSAHG